MSLLDDLLAEAIEARIDRAVAAERARAAQHEALVIQRHRQCAREVMRAMRAEAARPIELRIGDKVLARVVAGGDAKRRRNL